MKVTERTEYGDRLYRARKHAKLSQAALASKVELTQGAIAQLEKTGQGSGKTNRIAQVTGVRAAWLADDDGPMLEEAEPPAVARQIASEKVAHYLVGQPADYRTITLTLAAALAESGTELTVAQFVKLVEATHKKLSP